MTPMICDLAILGGGPAGAAAALEARRHGLSVSLWERGRFPRLKVCGEFISGESVSLLARLVPQVASRGISIRQSAFVSPRGKARVFDLPRPALGLSRRALDEALWRAALASGADCCAGTAAQKVCRLQASSGHPAGWEIESWAGTRIESRHLIVACGRWWAIEGLPSPAGWKGASPWLGFKAHFSGIAPADAVEMFYFPGGYCGLAPVEGRAVNVCCLVHRDLLKRTRAGHSVRDFRRWLARAVQSPALDCRLRSAVQITETLAAAPIHLARGAPAVAGAILAGDASGFLDPFTGDGISIALRSGTLAARLAAHSLSLAAGPAQAQDAARRYAREMRRAVGRSHGVASWLRQWVCAPAFAQKLAALALPLAGPALVRATRFRLERRQPSGIGLEPPAAGEPV